MATDLRQRKENFTGGDTAAANCPPVLPNAGAPVFEGAAGARRGELLASIAESAARLQQEIELQQNLVAAALQNCPKSGGLEAVAAGCPLRSREKRLKAAIQQSIEVLEASRRAFKSKQLEMLRKYLTRVLIDAS
jgi:hypothetical protein